MSKDASEQSIKITSSSHRETLFIKSFIKEDSDCALICLHGVTEYHKAFFHFRDFMAKKSGVDLFLPDLRGHGLSSGHRNFISDFDDFSKDVIKIIGEVSKNYEKKFLWGHSLGGLIALDIAFKDKELVDGIIVSNPPLVLKSRWPRLLTPYASVLTEGIPQARVPTLVRGKDLYTDKSFAKDYDQDPLINPFMGLKLCIETLEKAKYILQNSYFFDHHALFLLSGRDHLVNQDMTKNFIKSIPDNKIVVKEYKAMKHGIHNDKRSQNVFKDIYDWIQNTC